MEGMVKLESPAQGYNLSQFVDEPKDAIESGGKNLGDPDVFVNKAGGMNFSNAALVALEEHE